MKSLENAPFDLKATALVTVCRDCASCEFRTGNMLATFPHLKQRPNICTRPENYRAKVDAQREVLLAEYREKGHRVLTARESKPLFSGYYLVNGCGWAKANEAPVEDPKGRTLKQLGKLVKMLPAVACNGQGEVVELYEKKPLWEALFTAKVLKAQKSEGKGQRSELGLGFANAREQDETAEDKAARELDAKVEVETDRREALAYIEHVEGIKTHAEESVFLRWLLNMLVDNSDYPLTETLARRGLGTKPWTEMIEDLHGPVLRGIFMEVQLAGYYGLAGENPVGSLRSVQEAWPKLVDRKALEKAVRKELKEQAKAVAKIENHPDAALHSPVIPQEDIADAIARTEAKPPMPEFFKKAVKKSKPAKAPKAKVAVRKHKVKAKVKK